MEPEEKPQSPSARSTLAGLVVVGALVGFAGLLVYANVQGVVAETDGPGDAPLIAEGKGKGKLPPPGAKAKTKAKKPPSELLVDGGEHPRPPAPAGAKNLVVVVPTAVRKDHLTPYGADPALTPFFQDVATHGARFADVISAGPLGRYATGAALTGQPPAVVDLVDPRPGPDGKVLADSVVTMPELLRDAGWRTYGVTANLQINSDTGLAQGFDLYRDAQPFGFSPSARLEGPAVVKVALDLLDRRTPEERQRPFYLQVDFVDAHAPLRDVKEITNRFDPEKPNAVYRAAVHRVDDFAKRLWDALGQMGYTRENTYLVILGDHGEGLGDPPHHGKAHGRYLFETSVDVGWLVEGPDIPENRIVAGLASSTDAMPTLLDLVGLKAPDGIEGRSWAAQLRGESDRTTRQRAYSDTWYLDVNRAGIWTERMACLKDFGSRPDPSDTFGEGCFDRKTDPDFTDVKTDPDLTAELVAWRAQVAAHVTAPPPRGPPPRPAGEQGQGEPAPPDEEQPG